VLDNHALALPSREANNTLKPTTIAEELAAGQLDPHGIPLPGQVLEGARVAAVDTLGQVPTEGAQGNLAGGVDLDHDGLTGEAQPVERQAV